MLKFFFYNFKEDKTTEEILESIREMIEGTRQYERMEEIMLFVMIPDRSLEAVLAAFDRKYVKIASPTVFSVGTDPADAEKSLERFKEIGTDLVTTGLADSRSEGLENNTAAAEKLSAGLKAGLKVLFCVGEDVQNETSFAVIREQLQTGVRLIPLDSFYRCAILYRPLWAFGPDGKSSDASYTKEMFALIRKTAEEERPEFPEPLPLIYGGIMEEEEARGLLLDEIIDGVFIESDRMDTSSFVKFVNSCYPDHC